MWIFKKPNARTEPVAVSLIQLKQLLNLLAKTPDVSFRFCKYDTWMKNFTFVNTVNDKSVLLYSDADGKHITVNISDITSFELDNKLNIYLPFVQYKIDGSLALD